MMKKILGQAVRQFGGRQWTAALLTAMIFSGCNKDEIKTYRVPKEKPTAQTGMPEGRPDVGAPERQLKWKTPDGWKDAPLGEMRVASFRVAGANGKQADVSVIPLPGDAGGDFSNVNRWRNQVGQPPISDEQIKKLAQPVEVSGQPATFFEQSADKSADTALSILAVIQHRDGATWFFKMVGDSELVAQQKPAFLEFLKSLQIPTAQASAAQPPTGGSLPQGHPDISAMPQGTMSGTPSNEGKPQWNAPSGWKEVAGGQFLVAKFVIAGEGSAQAAVNVSQSAGEGGGLAMNVNRWRGQLKLDALSADEIAKLAKPLETKSGKATLVELSGADTSLVGVIVNLSGQAWFYKLMGDAKIVGAQRDAFLKFVQEVKY